MKALTDKILVHDLFCSEMAWHGQELNFQTIANGKIQKMEVELDKIRVKYSKLRKAFDEK